MSYGNVQNYIKFVKYQNNTKYFGIQHNMLYITEHVQLALAGFEPQTSVARVKHSTNVANRDIPLDKPSRSYFNTTRLHIYDANNIYTSIV